MNAITNYFCGDSIIAQLQTAKAQAAPLAIRQPLFNISTKRVGGLRFIKIGRFCASFTVTRSYKPL